MSASYVASVSSEISDLVSTLLCTDCEMAAQNMSPRLRNIRDRILGVLGPDKQVLLECTCYVAMDIARAPTGVIPVVHIECLLMVYRRQNVVLFQWLRQEGINYLVWCPMRYIIMGADNGYSDEEIRNWPSNEVGMAQAQED